MKAKDALVKLLRKEGVEYVFGIPGATEILFMEALERERSIKYVLGLNEIVCAAMAEGYARASGKPGFLNLHTGPGLAASMPMLYNAHAGGVPLVITVGQQDTRLLQYDPHLSGDIIGMGKLYTKWCAEPTHAEDLTATMQRAFKMAVQPPSGPVLISIPQDVLAQEIDFEYRSNTTIYPRLRPDRKALDKALTLLQGAKRPLILVESGVSRCDALDQVVRFAELTGARVYQQWMSDVNFPIRHPQYMGDLDPTSPQAGEILERADVLIGIGCPMFAVAFYNPDFTMPDGLRFIQIDDNPWEIGKNFPVDCGIQADIRATLEELNLALEGEMSPGDRNSVEKRVKEIKEERAKMEEELLELIEKERDRVPVSITRLMKEISEAMTPDTVIVDDCWSSSAMLRRILPLSRPNSFFRARKGGSIGWGLPGALGVQLGAPDKKVIAVCGDGSAAWSMQTLWTASRYGLPVTFVITNNASYRQVKLVRRIVLGDYPLDQKLQGMELDEPVIDFSQLSQSMGVKGFKVERPEELPGALKSALSSTGPTLIEVFVENRP